MIGGTADAYRRLPRKHTNAAGHVVASEYDYKFGVATKQEGPYFDPAPASPIRTLYAFDGLGRPASSTAPDGIVTTLTRSATVTSCPALSRYTETSATTGQPSVTVCFDAFSRETSRQTAAFGTGTVRVDTEYDAVGRLHRVSQPYLVGATVYWTTYTYDALNRPTVVTLPDSSNETTAYAGLVTTRTNALLQTKTETSDVRGKLLRVTEGTSSSMDYTYDAAGRVLSARDGANNAIGNQYDARGLKISMADPDMGVWGYSYDALGQLTIQIDAKSQATVFGYDLIGRMVSRNDPTGLTQWVYDLAANGVGQPYRTTGAEQSFQKTFEYDVYGRPTKSTTRVNGIDHVVQATYDTSGRREKTIYPGGFTTKSIYNANHYLSQVKDDGSTLVFWQADLVNPFGSVTKETLGNGLVTQRSFDPKTDALLTITTGLGGGAAVQNLSYVWDSLGNLSRRDDIANGRGEIFSYDNLNRLTTITGVSAPSKSVTYNPLGNITSRSGVGPYTYGTGIGSGAGPHAVKTANGVTYSYDGNGNMTSATNGRAVTYTAYNKPRTISSPVGNSTFYYGGERELVVQIESNGSTSATRTYVGDLYEKIATGGTTEERFYIQSPFGLVATRSTRTGQPTPTLQYAHRDHLGSTDVLSDATGAVVQRMSNDAWGKRRNATTWADSALYAFAFEGGVGQSVTPQFTGHKGLGHLELVHMRGRVYDPVLGRFLTADPYVQNPTSTQSFNRYSYVWNNPLSYTDPSGYNVFSRIGRGISRAWARWAAAQRRFAKKQGFTLVLGATVPYELGYPIGGAIDAALTGANVGEVLVAAAVAWASKGSTVNYWGSGSDDYGNVLDGGWAGRPEPKGLERRPSKYDTVVNFEPGYDPTPDLSVYPDFSGVFGWLGAKSRSAPARQDAGAALPPGVREVLEPARPAFGVFQGRTTIPIEVNAQQLRIELENISGVPAIAVTEVSVQTNTVPGVDLGQGGFNVLVGPTSVFNSEPIFSEAPLSLRVTIDVQNDAGVAARFYGVRLERRKPPIMQSRP